MTKTQRETMEIIKKTVDDLNKHGKQLTNRAELIRILHEKTQVTVSESSIRRYLNEMKFKIHSDGTYEFLSGDFFHFIDLIEERTFNSQLYFHVNPPHLSAYIAGEINRHFKHTNRGKDLYCIALHDILICLFDRESLKEKKLKNIINKILSEYALQTPSINYKKIEKSTE